VAAGKGREERKKNVRKFIGDKKMAGKAGNKLAHQMGSTVKVQ